MGIYEYKRAAETYARVYMRVHPPVRKRDIVRSPGIRVSRRTCVCSARVIGAMCTHGRRTDDDLCIRRRAIDRSGHKGTIIWQYIFHTRIRS